LGVGVVDKVVFDLLGLGCHLVVSVWFCGATMMEGVMVEGFEEV